MGTVPLQQLGGGPVRILLVEDELFVRMDVADALRRAGFQVIEAADADAAMEFINSGERIDLVFTDIWTPGVLNGLALAERVRAKFPMMPVIITSSNTTVEDAASRLGRFVPKPYEQNGSSNCSDSGEGHPRRQPLAQYLRDCGYRVLEAADGAEARETLSRGRHRIDVALIGAKSVPSESGLPSQCG